MTADFYNKTLHEIVKKVFAAANISELTAEVKYNEIANRTLVHISGSSKQPRYKGLEDYRYTTIIIYFDVEEDSSAKYGIKKTSESEGFVLWGYVKCDLSDFSPDDFTHYAPGVKDGQRGSNFFRDHLDSPEAKESIERFKERLESL